MSQAVVLNPPVSFGEVMMDPFKEYVPKAKQVTVRLTPGDAETVALQAVAWIVADDEMRDRFIAVTGCSGDDLRQRIDQSAFLGSVLDFVLSDERSLLDFAEHAGLPPELPMMARVKLP
ncbi:conserved protein of unknown function [Magnetospirillum sp. XM-1]|uniref:DUF3572 domain-containing protein n=1 Tax=Magnetospirillum sp. XM-1 TaxID=1663591 RepID=UPI00073DCA59|nr:DUF3572 domain-containing protein [Magnetospirillum sp. XM-1]CUW37160.1 conserved protein of unknown function [Magnetospirillum sp. XM-1]